MMNTQKFLTDRRPARALPILFFLSGASGLVYEVLWQENLALLFGRTWEATATVLAVFMAGLALGAGLAGRFADKSRTPLLIYSFLETGLALAALLVPTILAYLHPLYREVWHAMGEGWTLVSVRVLIAAVAMLPATMLMGATLPVLSRYAAGGSFKKELPLLYGANTLGAALGAMGASFLLIPFLGRSGTMLLAVVVTLAVAFLAARLAKGSAPLPSQLKAQRKREREQAKPILPIPKVPPGLRLLAFACGFITLGLEVFWTHHLALTFGSSVYAFGLMLGAMLTGLGVASLICARWTGAGRSPWPLILLSLCLGGLLVIISTPLLGQMPWFSASLVRVFAGNFFWFSLARFLCAFLLLGIPALTLGLVLPALVIAARHTDREARDTAAVYTANTAGAVLGPLFTGFCILPHWGSRLGLLGAGCAFLLLAILAGFYHRRQTLMLTGPAALAGLLLALLLPAWNEKVTASGFHLYALHLADEGLENALSRRKTIYFKEGVHGTVAAFDFATKNGEKRRTYSMNGKFEGSSNPHDMMTQTRVTEMPLALCPREPKDVYLLGLGTGASLASILRFPVTRVDVCELSPEVHHVAKTFFPEFNNKCLEDPRTRVILADGRHWLELTEQKYDVVISEPSNPWMAGVASLFTIEAFRSMRNHTRDGGLVCQWVQGYLLAEETFQTVLRNWLEVFPRSIAALSHRDTTDIFLVGLVDRAHPNREFRLDANRINKRLASRQPYPFGEKYTPRSLPDLLNAFLVGPKQLAIWAGEGVFHTDDHPRLQYEAPFNLYDKGSCLDKWTILPGLVEPPHTFLDQLSTADSNSLVNHHAFLLIRLLLRGGDRSATELPRESIDQLVERMDQLAQSDRAKETWLPNWYLGKFLCYGPCPGKADTGRVYARGFPRGKAIEAFFRAHQASPTSLDPLLDLAKVMARGEDGELGGIGSDPEGAIKIGQKALGLAPNTEGAALLVARLQYALGQEKASVKTLQDLLTNRPDCKRAKELLQFFSREMTRTPPKKK